jgi:phosphohistidine phosphatase
VSGVERAVVLMRHGEALPTFAHPERPLTRHGRAEAMESARWIAERVDGVAEVRHSSLLRSRQTAEIVAEELARAGCRRPELREAALGPGADPDTIAGDLGLDPRPVVLVGHVPFLDRLVHDMAGTSVLERLGTFGTAMALCLVRRDSAWELDWIFAPETIHRR